MQRVVLRHVALLFLGTDSPVSFLCVGVCAVCVDTMLMLMYKQMRLSRRQKRKSSFTWLINGAKLPFTSLIMVAPVFVAHGLRGTDIGRLARPSCGHNNRYVHASKPGQAYDACYVMHDAYIFEVGRRG